MFLWGHISSQSGLLPPAVPHGCPARGEGSPPAARLCPVVAGAVEIGGGERVRTEERLPPRLSIRGGTGVTGSFQVVWRNCGAKQQITEGLEVRVEGNFCPLFPLCLPTRGGGAAFCAVVCQTAVFQLSGWDGTDFLCIGSRCIQRGVMNVRVT